MRLAKVIAPWCGFLALALLGPGSVSAEDAAGLPGGATSLRETHGDWVVSCSVQTVDDRTGKACALSQELTDTKSGQRVLALELRPAGTSVDGTLVLPFGLTLANGVTLQIDDGQAGSPLAFRTCLPAGCIVPVAFDAKMLAALRNGTTLKVRTTRDGGGDMQLAISLKGFAGALDRTAALLK